MYFLFFFVINSVSKTFLTRINIDGIPLHSFSSTKHDYFVQIPYSKNRVKINAFTNNPKKPAKIYLDKKEMVMGSLLNCTGFTSFRITYESVDKKSHQYNLNFVHVSPIRDPIRISTSKRLTPKNIEQSPLINSPKIVGTLGNTDFLHYISTTGERPIKFTAAGLPTTLTLDEDKGIIKGTSPKEQGEYKVNITATNIYGSDEIALKIVVGDKQRLTPVQGWSSWYTQSLAISEDGVIQMAESAVRNGINDYGYLYMNIDDAWQGPRNNEKPPKLVGKRPFINNGISYGGFGDFNNLTSYLHSIGLKAGIYSGPKPSTYAGFLGSSSYNESGMDYDIFSPNNGNPNSRGPIFDSNGTGSGSDGLPGVYQPTQYYGSSFIEYETSAGGKEVGPIWLGPVDVQTFADWGFDFMKWDWLLLGNKSLTSTITDSLNKASINSGRSMVLSLSNNIGHDHQFMQSMKEIGASMARISLDIMDNWFSMIATARESLYFIDLAASKEGFWPDLDMLQIGYLGNAGGLNTQFHKTHLSNDEQYFQISFWAIYPAPMILSCDLSQLDGDDFTLGLIKNREVTLINQDSLGATTKLLNKQESILVRELDDGTVALGVFNYGNLEIDLTVKLEDVENETGVKFPKGARLRSVWDQIDVGVVDGEFNINLKMHQGFLYKLIPIA